MLLEMASCDASAAALENLGQGLFGVQLEVRESSSPTGRPPPQNLSLIQLINQKSVIFQVYYLTCTGFSLFSDYCIVQFLVAILLGP